MITQFTAISAAGFREALRNRVTLVVVIFTVVLLLSSLLLTEVTVATFDRVLTDVGLGLITLVLVPLAIFLSGAALGREIERRTIFLVMSKPISRGLFLVARYAGVVVTVLLLLVAMAGVFAIQQKIYGAKLTVSQAQALGLFGVELAVLCALGFFFSSFAGTLPATFMTASLYLAGHLSGDLYRAASKSDSALIRAIGKGLFYVLPNLDRLDLRPRATYAKVTPAGELLSSAAYGIAFSALLLVLAVMLFRRRDFK